MKRLRHFVFDVTGVLLIVVSPTLGWLPGPGGIPLFLAGLGLLAVHHDWAARLYESVKRNGLKLMEKIFIDHPVWQAFYDLASIALVIGGIYLFNVYTQNLTLSLAILLLFTGLALFLGNRKRLESFTRSLKQVFRR